MFFRYLKDLTMIISSELKNINLTYKSSDKIEVTDNFANIEFTNRNFLPT